MRQRFVIPNVTFRAEDDSRWCASANKYLWLHHVFSYTIFGVSNRFQVITLTPGTTGIYLFFSFVRIYTRFGGKCSTLVGLLPKQKCYCVSVYRISLHVVVSDKVNMRERKKGLHVANILQVKPQDTDKGKRCIMTMIEPRYIEIIPTQSV